MTSAFTQNPHRSFALIRHCSLCQGAGSLGNPHGGWQGRASPSNPKQGAGHAGDPPGQPGVQLTRQAHSNEMPPITMGEVNLGSDPNNNKQVLTKSSVSP